MKKYMRLVMLLSFSIVLSILESFIPLFNGYIPGLKLGLANIIVLIVLYKYDTKDVFFVSVLMAIKYNEDIIYNFNYYSLISGMSINELQQLEIDFVALLRFKLYINIIEFSNYKLLFDNADNDDEDNIFE